VRQPKHGFEVGSRHASRHASVYSDAGKECFWYRMCFGAVRGCARQHLNTLTPAPSLSNVLRVGMRIHDRVLLATHPSRLRDLTDSLALGARSQDTGARQRPPSASPGCSSASRFLSCPTLPTQPVCVRVHMRVRACHTCAYSSQGKAAGRDQTREVDKRFRQVRVEGVRGAKGAGRLQEEGGSSGHAEHLRGAGVDG
jgi:hypothetical protein